MRLSKLFRNQVFLSLILSAASSGIALERPDKEFKVFQFPADAIPCIDGKVEDWSIVPESYVVGTSELWEDSGKHQGILPESLDVRVRVGWVKGTSQLYFLYEAYDNYWDFSLPGLKNDTFEIVVDGDLSGGPLVSRFRENAELVSEDEAYFTMHGEHAQNYHIFTPARDKSWAMYWGPQQWLKALPFANAAYQYDFEPGESGHLTLEFFVTVFDHASKEGPSQSELTHFVEQQLIGLSWAIIDYDDVQSPKNNGFWNLSTAHTMYGKASELVAFRLMPLEPDFQKPGKAAWNCRLVDLDRRLVAFKDETAGEVTSWSWDFGDGNTSDEQHPVHQYASAGHYVVVLKVDGPHGPSQYSRVWDVSLK